MSTVHLVVPAGIDDPATPSGGNHYDRRLCDELPAAGWRVAEHAVAGRWPRPDAAAIAGLGRRLAAIPDRAVVLLDGLIASAAPTVLVPESARLRLVVLVHLPLGDRPASGSEVTVPAVGEAAVLAAASAVITTSRWSRQRLLELYPQLPAERVQVAEPGADPAALAPGTAGGGGLLCVAAVIPGKGHESLLAALASVAELAWQCSWVGSLDRAPAFVDRLRQQAVSAGIAERICFGGPYTGARLAQAYAAADALVLASHAETYGMVVTEALARGLPVLATAVGGVPEALGRTATGERPGMLVPPGDRDALSAALRDWLIDGELRCRLRQAACERRTTLAGWSRTAELIARVLTRVDGVTAVAG